MAADSKPRTWEGMTLDVASSNTSPVVGRHTRPSVHAAPRRRKRAAPAILVCTFFCAASCMTVDTLRDSIWRETPSLKRGGLGSRETLPAFAGPGRPPASSRLRLRHSPMELHTEVRGSLLTSCPRHNVEALKCAKVGMPIARFIPALRHRVRRDLVGQQAAGGRDDFNGDEVAALEVYDVRLDGSKRRRVLWDAERGRLVSVGVKKQEGEAASGIIENEFTSASTLAGGPGSVLSPVKAWAVLVSQVKQAFLPRGVTSDYYAFTLWRMAQRIVSSSVSVFGTQSLLLALGVKTSKVGAAAAAGWVWANAIGKFGKTAFAARYGRAFDSDAKRWRLRAALMWVIANGMEILTFVVQGVFAQGFTFLVACSVSLKQVGGCCCSS